MPLQLRNTSSASLGTLAILFSLLLTSCNPTQVQPSGIRSAGADGVNTSLLGKAYVYEDNPIILTGNKLPAASVNMGKLASSTPQQITPADKTYLANDCGFTQVKYDTDYSYTDPTTRTFQDCLSVIQSDDPTVTPLQPVSGNWVFTSNAPAFYQVNAMYHAKKLTTRMHDTLSFIHKKLHFSDSMKNLPPAIPYLLGDMGTWWHKYTTGTSLMTKSAQLTVQSQGNIENNAYYDPITNQVVLGYLAKNGVKNGAFMVQDPSVLYHEMGHAFMTVFLNMRNAQYVGGIWKPLPYQSFPFYGAYDELSAMGEGIADYLSYFMNGRTTFAEWGLGRFSNLARPITEDNPLHAPGISSAVDERVSYPDLLLYLPQNPATPLEDVHNAGMITSHYLVALTEALKTECYMDQDMATKHVMLLLAESFAFLGDLTGRGTDYNNTLDIATSKPKALVNLHPNGAYEWYYGTRRITMRRFYQTFARNILHTISNNICPEFSQPKSEQLLDMYGLLLFKHYDDNGTFSGSASAQATREDSFVMSSTNGLMNSDVNMRVGTSWIPVNDPYSIFTGTYFDTRRLTATAASPTNVDESNRTKTVLIPKSSLAFSAAGVNASLILDDSQEFGQNIAANTLFEGRVISPTIGIAGYQYNNDNHRISPGEVVGLVLNLTNNSSLPMGGVTILATPWAHMKVAKVSGVPTWKGVPCTINNFPSTSEGGTTCDDGDILPADGRRFRKPSSTNPWPEKALHPVCLAQINTANETRWVSQDEYRRTILQIEDKNCLGYGTPDFSPAECLMRFLPGRDSAFLAKIDAQKTYRTSVDPSGTSKIPLSSGLALEVNKWIPPGTFFTCRLRAQFSNCSDCFQSAAGQDEFTDLEYGGHKPFKVFDVPITILD